MKLTLLLLLLISLQVAPSIISMPEGAEKLSYSTHHRVKRPGILSQSPVVIRFKAFNRLFQLKLFPLSDHRSAFRPDLIVNHHGKEEPIRIEDESLYEGYVEGDGGSLVYGSVHDGVLDGRIELSNGQAFTVERTSRHSLDYRLFFHSYIYSDEQAEKAMPDSRRERSAGHRASCGMTKDIEKWMESQQTLDQTTTLTSFIDERNKKSRGRRTLDKDEKGMSNNVRSCTLHVYVDQVLYAYYHKHHGDNIHEQTRKKLTDYIHKMVTGVNEIYEITDFDGIRGINFLVQLITIYEPDECKGGKPTNKFDRTCPFCNTHLDVSSFLNTHSVQDHSKFCLAYVFTYRDFEGGTVGLAWRARMEANTAGGICTPRLTINKEEKSLNSGIVTLTNSGMTLNDNIVKLVLAHEFGHNFGSPHDDSGKCVPGENTGNYLMYPSSTDGYKPNNKKFSTCSIKDMSNILNKILVNDPIDLNSDTSKDISRNCFSERKAAFCGNQKTEEGEECDCGYTNQDCNKMGDKCCISPEESTLHARKEFACKRRRENGTVCAPSEGSCCADDCKYIQEQAKTVCNKETECKANSYCNGTSALCPEQKPRREGEECDDGSRVCKDGQCSGSICEALGLQDCQITDGNAQDKCFLACMKDGVCVSSRNMTEFKANRQKYKQNFRLGQKGILRGQSALCDNGKGYCDIFRKCRLLQAEGPFKKLMNFASPETIEEGQRIIKQYWWAFLLGGLGILIFLILFIKVCAVHTPSSNPSLRKARNLALKRKTKEKKDKEKEKEKKEKEKTKERLRKTKEDIKKTKEEANKSKEMVKKTNEVVKKTKEEVNKPKEEVNKSKEMFIMPKEEMKKSKEVFNMPKEKTPIGTPTPTPENEEEEEDE